MKEIEEYLNDLVLKKIVPGFTYSIIYNNQLVEGSVGLKNIITKEKTNINDLYDLASLSKVIATTTIISRMIDKKMIKLNDLVIKYLKDFKHKDITILNLLTHTSGLTRLGYKKVVDKENIINDIYSKDKTFETNKDLKYSDLNFIFLGLIIEKIYNKPLDKVAYEEVFKPLNMISTTYLPSKDKCAPTELVDSHLIQGEVHDEKARSMNGVSGHAGVFSNVADLTNLVTMVLNKGVFNNEIYLSEKIIDLWFKKLAKGHKDKRFRSIGWIVGNNKHIIIRHTNAISFSGFTGPSISIDRKNNVGIILLTNRVHPTRKNEKIYAYRIKISKFIYDTFKI